MGRPATAGQADGARAMLVVAGLWAAATGWPVEWCSGIWKELAGAWWAPWWVWWVWWAGGSYTEVW